jgi:hypothetical protein
MTKEEAFEILEHIATLYPTYELNERKIAILYTYLSKMDYKRVKRNLFDYVCNFRTPPALSDIAAYPLAKLLQEDKPEEEAEISPEAKKKLQEQIEKLIAKISGDKQPSSTSNTGSCHPENNPFDFNQEWDTSQVG